MNRKDHSSENIGCLRGSTGELNMEPHESIEIPIVEEAQPAGQTVEPAAEKQQDEKIEHWMENIKEFIRNIDVKAL